MMGCIVNYNHDPQDWWLEYDMDATMYDRSDDGIKRTFSAKTYETKNIGDVDYDKLGYLIEHYDNLPDLFFWGKSNIHKYCPKDELDVLMKQTIFTPLLTKTHRTYMDHFGTVNYYAGEMYHERADSWFFNAGGVDSKYFNNWHDWCIHFGLPRTQYIPFAPGGNYLLTKECVHRYSRDFYEEMRDMLPHSRRPAEAQAAERSYFLMWR
jgi:hypothetical protein